MLEPTASRFWQAAMQSGLMDAAGLLACWDALPPEKRTPDAIDRRMARQAVQAGRLTLWQAQQLVAGRSTGFKIDRYVLLELIGQGGMGRVYLARDTRLDRLVALKILSPERVNNPRAIARFQREARVGAQLQHENLVRIYDVGESNGRCYLVMEYIEGRNIGQMIADAGPIPPPVAARLARQVALGLEHAQRKGLIHRDVNPYNILVTREGVAKLTDLGLAIDLADQEKVTRDGATVGTFDYVSPEQARHSHNVDTRSDIYSLGCTLYHMISGRVPFPSASLPEKLFGHQAVEPEPLTKLVPKLPPGLSAVVARMLRKLPEERYATPLDLAVALEPFDDTAGAAADITPPIRTLPAAGLDAARAGLVPDAGAVASRSTASGIQTVPSRPPLEGAHAAAASAAAATAVTAAVAPAGLGPSVPLTRPSPPAAVPAPLAVPAPALGNAPASAAPVAAASVVAPPPPPPPAAPKPKPATAAAPGGRHGLNLAVDLGPEPSLTEGLTSTRARSRVKDREKSALTAVAAARAMATAGVGPVMSRPWFVPAVAVALVVALAGAFVAYQAFSGGAGAATKAAQGQGQGQSGGAGPVKSFPNGAGKAKRTRPKGQEVAVVGADGLMEIEPDFRTAVTAAIGGRGYVVLLNDKPLRLKAADALVASGGNLVIRAGEGLRPVIEVEVRGRKPFLATKTDTALRLEGVTVVARYTDPGPDPAPVIEAGGGVTLDRCAFRVVGPERGPVAGARAVVMEGALSLANGCWFENFDRALDLAAYSGSTATVRQCLFLHNRPDDSAVGGWAVRLRSMPGGASQVGRRLVLEHCTARGRGLLELAGFSPRSPLRVDVRGCAVLADALVAWESAVPQGTPAAAPNREALSWLGDGNQYDVRGQSWLLLAPVGGAAEPSPDGPTTLDAWKARFGAENAPVPPPVRFATDSPALPEHPDPADFAVTSPGTDRPVGADPAQVGPGGRPAVAARRP